MGAVTGSQEWDFFLSLLQAEIEGLTKYIDSQQSSYVSDPSFDPTHMAEQKARLIEATAQRSTLQEVLSLPKRIIEQGEKAKIALSRLTDE